MSNEITKQENWHIETSTEQQAGPHIPAIQWETVYGPISNTTIATFLFLVIVVIFSILGKLALVKRDSKLKMFFISFIKFFDTHLQDSFGNKKFARAYYPLVVGVFFIIFFGNLFWLIIDWLGASISPTIFHYVRPMHSDLNTTFVLALITVTFFLWISMKTQWATKFTKWYLFNFHGKNILEKLINVFVWWLHLIWVPVTLASLSLRLFGNIFAWIVLIWVITYLWSTISSNLLEAGRFLAIPFWFFEVFVAFIQAVVFAGLMISYFNQAREKSH